MFKIGDKIKGKACARRYGVTDHDAVMEVVAIITGARLDDIRVKVLVAPPGRESCLGLMYPVKSTYFELWIPEHTVTVCSSDYMDCDELSDEDKKLIGVALCLK